jgi:hypothetical protein
VKRNCGFWGSAPPLHDARERIQVWSIQKVWAVLEDKSQAFVRPLEHKFAVHTLQILCQSLDIWNKIAAQSWQEFLLIIVSAASSACFLVDTNSTSDAALGVPSTATQQQIRDAYKRYLSLSPLLYNTN